MQDRGAIVNSYNKFKQHVAAGQHKYDTLFLLSWRFGGAFGD